MTCGTEDTKPAYLAVCDVEFTAAVIGHRYRIGDWVGSSVRSLARGKGRVVIRLVEQCWDERFVGDDVINRAISTLRRFAGRVGGLEIETVPGAGYRLVDKLAVTQIPTMFGAVARFATVRSWMR